MEQCGYVRSAVNKAKTSALVKEAKCAIAALKVIGILRFMPIFVVLSSLQSKEPLVYMSSND
jgi:hypothetical protein